MSVEDSIYRIGNQLSEAQSINNRFNSGGKWDDSLCVPGEWFDVDDEDIEAAIDSTSKGLHVVHVVPANVSKTVERAAASIQCQSDIKPYLSLTLGESLSHPSTWSSRTLGRRKLGEGAYVASMNFTRASEKGKFADYNRKQRMKRDSTTEDRIDTWPTAVEGLALVALDPEHLKELFKRLDANKIILPGLSVHSKANEVVALRKTDEGFTVGAHWKKDEGSLHDPRTVIAVTTGLRPLNKRS